MEAPLMTRYLLIALSLALIAALLIPTPQSRAQDGEDPIEQSLNGLGVNTAPGQRFDANGNPIPDGTTGPQAPPRPDGLDPAHGPER